jgi:heme A synthase
LNIFFILIVTQFWLGVFTLVLVVPIVLAVLHQVTACLLVGAAVFMNYTFRGQDHA